jgi:hypothetical protein
MFDLTAARRGDHWRLATDERNAVGNSLANVLRHVNLPERELGIAADVAALGFTFYAIVTPRLELERRALEAAQSPQFGNRPAAASPPPPQSPHLGDAAPSFVDDADRLMRQAFPDGFDMQNPAHVARLNEIARTVVPNDATGGIDVGGNAVGGPAVRSVFADGELGYNGGAQS